MGAIRHHHEKLDGSGYPDGLKDDAITIEARILAVADIYDALTTDRRYRQAMTSDEAVDILREEAAIGKLDGRVVEDLIGIINPTGTTQPTSANYSQPSCALDDMEADSRQLRSRCK